MNDVLSAPPPDLTGIAPKGPAPVTPLRRRRGHLGLLVVWLALLVIPAVAPNGYIVGLAVQFCINAMLVSSLNLLTGFGGQLSLSHAGFYGLGAYATGILSAKYGVSPWLGLPAAVAVTTASAILIGVPSLRLRGHYLAMATLGFNAIVTVLFYELVRWTGGADGLSGIPSLHLFGFSLANPSRFFYFAWAVAGLCLAGLLNLIDSRFGRGLRALSSSELAASSMGVDIFTYKLRLFALTAGMAGVAGFLFAHFNNFVTPESFDFSVSVLLVVMVAVGGTGRFWGGIIGALILTALPEVLRSVEPALAAIGVRFDTSAAATFVFGVSLILILLFLPGGLWSGIEATFRRRS